MSHVVSRLQARRDALAATLQRAAIRDAVLIGSAVYDPEAARDIDIVVTAGAANATPEQDLAEALARVAGSRVDLILRRPGEDLGGLALALLAGEVLVGNGETLREARACFEKAGGFTNAFDQAAASLRSAVRSFSWAAQEQTPQDRAECYQTAFDKLFHAARIAALCYLGRDSGGWGGLPRVLPPPFGQQFKDMVATLHIRFGYEGRIPQGGEAAEFEAWRQRVEAFVAAMRHLVAGRGGSAAVPQAPPEPGLPPEPPER